MKILIDLQCFISDSEKRGIGRYSYNLIKNLKNIRESEETVEFFGLLPARFYERFLSSSASSLFKRNQIFLFSSEPVGFENFDNLNTINRFSIFQSIKGMKFDLFLQLSPLAEPGLTWVSPDFLYDSMPTFSVFYDGITPEKNINDNDFQLSRFQERIQYLSNIVGFLSISKKSDDELKMLLNKDFSSIVVGGGPTLDSTQHISALASKEGLSFFFPGAGDPRKGAEVLVDAVRLVSSNLPNETRFVLSGMENDFGIKIRKMTQAYGIENYFQFRGTLTDQELTENYQTSTAVIFPSRREGLGLPVLDAQSIGKPCLISQAEELIEISCDDDFSFRVDDSAHLGEIIQTFVNDEGFRNKRVAIAEEAKLSTQQMWQNVAEKTYEFIKVRVNSSRMNKRQANYNFAKNVFITPLPPEQTGIADRNAALLPALGKQVEVGSKHSFDAFMDVITANNVLLTLGNSPHNIPAFTFIPFCQPIFDVHDSSIDRFFETLPYENLGTTLPNYLLLNFGINYVTEMKSSTEIGITLGKKLLENLIYTNKTIITHNESAHTALKSNYLIPLWERGFKSKTKKDIKFGKTLIVSSFGFIDESKQLDLLIEILSASRFRDQIQLFIVGEGNPNLVSELRSKSEEKNLKVTFTGYVSLERYLEILNKTDIAVQLRSSERLETPGSVLDCLESRVPTISNSKIASSQFQGSPFFIYAASSSDISNSIDSLLSGEFTEFDSEENPEDVRNFPLSKAVVSYRDILRENLISYPYLTNQKHDQIVASLNSLKSPLDYLKNFIITPQKKRIFLVLTDEVSKSSVDGILRVSMNLFKEFVSDLNVILIPIIRRGDSFFIADDLGLIDPGFIEISRKFNLTKLPVQPQQSDVIIFPGMDGSLHEALDVLEFWRSRGTRIVSVIHDVLPLTNPELFLDWFPNVFQDWFNSALAISTDLVFDSQTSAECSSKYIHSGGSNHLHKVVIRPSVNLVSVKLEKQSDRSSYIMLGTIEPRKGHAYVLDQFELLWKSGYQVSLILVGKAGWNCDELILRIQNLILNGKSIQWVSNATDEEVSSLLSESIFLICASTHEGYCLPGIEAHSLGVGVIARDIPIYREVLGEFAYFFEETFSAKATELSNIIQAIIEGNDEQFKLNSIESTLTSPQNLLETTWSEFIK